MAKDPAFLFYSQDFYTGVATLNWEDRGKFISILCLMHQQGRMKEETIRFLVGSISDNLKSKFSIDEKGLWFNKRLEDEATKRNKFTESRRENGLLGGRPKAKGKPKQKLKVIHMANHMGNENEIVNEDVIKDKSDLVEKLLNDELYVEGLRNAHRGKDIKQAFEECYIHHSNAPNPPRSLGEWKQKLNTWLSNTKINGKSNNKQQHTNSIKDTIRNTYGYTDKS